MHSRSLGGTGFDVSEIGFGAWAIGGSWGPVDDDTSLAALHRAVDAGVNFIDTADVYGDGRSERLIGTLLHDHPDLVVATKAGRRLEAHTADGYTAPNLERFVDRSLRNLGAEAVDLLREATEPSLLLDPQLPPDKGPAGRMVSFPTELASTSAILDRITEAAGLAWDLRWGLVFIAEPKRLAELPRGDGKPVPYVNVPPWEHAVHTYLNAPISFAFDDVPLPEALEAVMRGVVYELRIPDEMQETMRRVRVRHAANWISVRHALVSLLVPRGFSFEIRKEGIVVR